MISGIYVVITVAVSPIEIVGLSVLKLIPVNAISPSVTLINTGVETVPTLAVTGDSP